MLLRLLVCPQAFCLCLHCSAASFTPVRCFTAPGRHAGLVPAPATASSPPRKGMTPPTAKAGAAIPPPPQRRRFRPEEEDSDPIPHDVLQKLLGQAEDNASQGAGQQAAGEEPAGPACDDVEMLALDQDEAEPGENPLKESTNMQGSPAKVRL